MTVFVGLDQHRAQITAEWLDTATGEVSRTRIAPGDRDGVRRFLSRFVGLELEVALEATTGWRFVVEELRAIGAQVHLAEPAETSARRGNKKRAKTDWADARHLRELLMVDRLPESWIPPDHLLDLRAKVRLRHALVNQRGEWLQRIQSVLYHHGVAARRDLRTRENRQWLDQLQLAAVARQQIDVGLAVIDAVDVQLDQITRELRNYARRQPGCKALQTLYGIGPLTAVVVLAELGDARRFSSSKPFIKSHVELWDRRYSHNLRVLPPDREGEGAACERLMPPAGHVSVEDVPTPKPSGTGVPFIERDGHLLTPIEVPFYDALRETGATFAVQPWVQGVDGRYRPDFIVFYGGASVIVELDGHEGHKSKDQRTRDSRKARWFDKRGMKVVRHTGTEVHADVQACVKDLLDVLRQSQSRY